MPRQTNDLKFDRMVWRRGDEKPKTAGTYPVILRAANGDIFPAIGVFDSKKWNADAAAQTVVFFCELRVKGT